MDFWIRAAQLLLALSMLVVLHELGHYIPAKLFKTRVEKFYLFFDPWFSLFKKKIGDTEWGIGWLPLGGYVKISGMVDESMDKDQLAQEPKPWEFRSKPAWQRLIIMLGGVTVNLIVGILIYIGVSYYYGEQKIDGDKLTAGLSVHPIMNQFGIESGDQVIEVEGEAVKNVLEVNNEIMLRGARQIKVKKADGSIVDVSLPEDINKTLFKGDAFPVISLRSVGVVIDSVVPGSVAANSHLAKEDKILSVNGNTVTYFDDLQKELYHLRGKAADLTILRDGDTVLTQVVVTENGTLGFQRKAVEFLDQNKIYQAKYSFGESITVGWNKGFNTLHDYVGQLPLVFTKKGAGSVGGFGSIGKMFPTTWDWETFWMRTAFISIVLAFMNILPIPALDGGHVVFLLYEIITGKEAPQKVLEYAQTVGFVILLTLLVYANGNDIYQALFK